MGYFLASLAIAMVIASIKVYQKRKEVDKVNENIRSSFLESHVQAGHLQKDRIGELTVYYEKDIEGEVRKNTANIGHNWVTNHKVLFLFFAWMVGTLTLTVLWPAYVWRRLINSSQS